MRHAVPARSAAGRRFACVAATLSLALLAGCYETERPSEYSPTTHAADLTAQAVQAFQEGRVEDALPLLDDAIKDDPSFPLPYKNKAVVLGTLKRYDEAAAALSQVLAFQPEDADAHLALGIFQERLGDKRAASDSYGRALDLYEKQPEQPDTDLERRLNIVQASYLLHGRAEAIIAINDVLARYPGSDLAQVYKYRILAEQRDAFLAGGLSRTSTASAEDNTTRPSRPE